MTLVLETAELVGKSAPGFDESRKLAVIWIDWYFYHFARFRALLGRMTVPVQLTGLELVGRDGVHKGLIFRENLPADIHVQTLFARQGWRDVGALQLARGVWSRLSRIRPNVILVPGYYTLPALAAALWGKIYRSKTVLMTETTAHDHRRVWWREAIKSVLLKSLFDWAISGGRPHRRYLEQLGFPSERIGRFYDVVDNQFFDTRTTAIRKHFSPAKFGLPGQYFLYVGRLAEEKNLVTLINAYQGYRQTGGSWSLVLVGDGPENHSLCALARSSEYEKDIRFEGLKKSEELPLYYAFAGCFVLPSTREPWGLVVNEAMASGLPVIVSKRCGCSEDLVQHDENGFVFDPDDVSQLITCLSSVAAAAPQRLRAMGRRSRQIISCFSPQAWADEVVRIANTQ